LVVINVKYGNKDDMSKEIIETNKKVVSCNGQEEDGDGHPLVWLKIKEASYFIDCPYCERRFTITSSEKKND
jgi:uncharacterized Zn-finger protein